MSGVSLAVTILIATPGLVMLAITGYLVALAVAALRYRPPAEAADPPGSTTVMVVIPAHNEELLIERCVAKLRNQTYPSDRYGILVVADNCTDHTASVAARAGASVLERVDPTRRGKGWALQFAIDTLLARPDAPRAVIIVDEVVRHASGKPDYTWARKVATEATSIAETPRRAASQDSEEAP